MSDIASADGTAQTFAPDPRRIAIVVGALGIAQVFAWGGSYYLLAVLAEPIAADTAWPFAWVVGGLSLGLLVAGLVSPRMGRAVAGRGGRTVLATSSLLLASGLAWIAVSPSLVLYLAGWMVIGLGMGIGLYDAAFATLGQQFGTAARGPITALTLIAGFSSTVSWPLSAWLVEWLGWRGTCLAYAALQVALCLPLYLTFVPAAAPRRAQDAPAGAPVAHDGDRGENRAFYLVAAAITLIAAITAIMSVNMIVILGAVGLEQNHAVALAALLGPSQVAARLVEMVWGRRYHPALTLVVATGAVSAGILLLLVAPDAALIAIILYGGGIGVAWVARGTVPMALFGPEKYTVRLGRIARPGLIAQAVAPLLGAVLLQRWGVVATLGILAAAALAAAAFAAGLMREVGAGK